MRWGQAAHSENNLTILAYSWGVRGIAPPETFHVIQMGWLIGFFYVVCCAWRLARFNLQGMAPGGNRYFAGMPTPAGAMMVAAVIHFHSNPIQDGRLSSLWLLLLVACRSDFVTADAAGGVEYFHWIGRALAEYALM